MEFIDFLFLAEQFFLRLFELINTSNNYELGFQDITYLIVLVNLLWVRNDTSNNHEKA